MFLKLSNSIGRDFKWVLLCKNMSCYNTGPEIKILGMKNGHAWDLQFCCGFFWLQSLYFQLCTCSSSRPEVFCKKSVLRNFAKSQENTCARDSFSEILWHRCFPVNFAEFLRTPFFTEHFRWLFLRFRHQLDLTHRSIWFFSNAMQLSCSSALNHNTEIDNFLTAEDDKYCKNHRHDSHVSDVIDNYIGNCLIICLRS